MMIPATNSEWLLADDETGKLRMRVRAASFARDYVDVEIWDGDRWNAPSQILLSEFWKQARPADEPRSWWQKVLDFLGQW